MNQVAGQVTTSLQDRVGRVEFAHPKGNCLSSSMLRSLTEAVDLFDRDPAVGVILIRSAGPGAFCGGAFFSEVEAIKNEQEGELFFRGFANLILAMRRASKLIVSAVQGKVVGGGCGLVAASDYAVATVDAAARLSEFELGFGPFVIGPAVARRVGQTAFEQMAIDCQWRTASWLAEKGLYAALYNTEAEMSAALETLMSQLASRSARATAALKMANWQGTESWEVLLGERAKTSGSLAIK